MNRFGKEGVYFEFTEAFRGFAFTLFETQPGSLEFSLSRPVPSSKLVPTKSAFDCEERELI